MIDPSGCIVNNGLERSRVEARKPILDQGTDNGSSD